MTAPETGGAGAGTCGLFVDGGWQQAAGHCTLTGARMIMQVQLFDGPPTTQMPLAIFTPGVESGDIFSWEIDNLPGGTVNQLLDCDLWIAGVNDAGTREVVGQFTLPEQTYTTFPLGQIHGVPQAPPLPGECTIVTSRNPDLMGMACEPNQPNTTTAHAHMWTQADPPENGRGAFIHDFSAGVNTEPGTVFGLAPVSPSQIQMIENREVYVDLDSGDPFNATTTIGARPDPCQGTGTQICFGPRYRLTMTPLGTATHLASSRSSALAGEVVFHLGTQPDGKGETVSSLAYVGYMVLCDPLSGQLSVSLDTLKQGSLPYEIQVTVTDLVDNVSRNYVVKTDMPAVRDPQAFSCSPFLE